ncbi:hypothetical protein P170DRAFT_83456 [Aspergillus steynii IBT 23096]|uniref:Uncharacterized protein n=1 Tax=Aspergillus steynii IBT 23096 TaxID=1392250 RepID=A0A2I2GFN8_9EURO|nr:uncharacterized protein P170DRAFT_83456 [Aspergillus steynii IBT 23096]PLB51696.1 hypothetical protein P170DRAFT_83456 [Aspergillus steynii IBT 23096]
MTIYLFHCVPSRVFLFFCLFFFFSFFLGTVVFALMISFLFYSYPIFWVVLVDSFPVVAFAVSYTFLPLFPLSLPNPRALACCHSVRLIV